MKDSEAARKLRRMFRDLGAPPAADAVLNNLARPAPNERMKSDRTEQLNLRVPAKIKKQVRVLATRDEISLAEVVIRALALYEEKYGVAREV